MGKRDSELKKLVREQAKDKKSFLVYSRLTNTPTFNHLSSETVSGITSKFSAAGLSDAEQICFLAKHVLGWSKLHISKVLKCMGQSHTAINKHLESAGKKLAKHILDQDGSEKQLSKPKEHMLETDDEEISEIFKEYSDHERVWRKKERKGFNQNDDN